MSKSMLCSALVVAASAMASAQTRVIFSNIAGFSTNYVPSFSGATWRTGSAGPSKPFFSPDDSWWIMSHEIATASTTVNDEAIVIGRGLDSSTYKTIFREATATPFDATRNWFQFDAGMGINDSGFFAVSADLDGATANDDVIVKSDGGTTTVMAREGSPIGFLTGNYGSANGSASMLNDGRTAHLSLTLNGTTGRNALMIVDGLGGGNLVQEADVTVPTGQMVLPTQTIDTFSSERFRINGAGTSYIFRGALNGPTATNDVFVFNNAVVAQEGAPLPGSLVPNNVSVLSADLSSQDLSSNGLHWMCRGTWATTNNDWVLKNGVVVAQTDTLISPLPGTTLQWDDTTFSSTFFFSTTNNYGDYVVGGLTNNPDVAQDALLMLNGGTVALRENTELDLDNNGTLDGYFIRIFDNDQGKLTDSNDLYLTVEVRTAAVTTSIGTVYLMVRLPLTGDVDNNNEVGPSDFSEVLAGFGAELGGPGYTNGGTDPTDRDQDNNGEIGPGDFSVVLSNFGRERSPLP